jgi:hypothetical protein
VELRSGWKGKAKFIVERQDAMRDSSDNSRDDVAACGTSTDSPLPHHPHRCQANTSSSLLPLATSIPYFVLASCILASLSTLNFKQSFCEEEEEEEEELLAEGPSVNEVSFRARPYHNVHRTLGVDTGATDPL